MRLVVDGIIFSGVFGFSTIGREKRHMRQSTIDDNNGKRYKIEFFVPIDLFFVCDFHFYFRSPGQVHQRKCTFSVFVRHVGMLNCRKVTFAYTGNKTVCKSGNQHAFIT